MSWPSVGYKDRTMTLQLQLVTAVHMASSAGTSVSCHLLHCTARSIRDAPVAWRQRWPGDLLVFIRSSGASKLSLLQPSVSWELSAASNMHTDGAD